MINLEIIHDYDAARWQVAKSSGDSFLLTWTLSPQPPDAAIPASVACLFAHALLDLGELAFGGDAGAESVVMMVPVRRWLRFGQVALVSAGSVAAALPAFDCAGHDWSQNAQWLIVANPAISALPADGLKRLVQQLFQEWSLPRSFPPGVVVIVQAAVDGDGAPCHCRDGEIAKRLMNSLEFYAGSAGASFAVRESPRSAD